MIEPHPLGRRRARAAALVCVALALAAAWAWWQQGPREQAVALLDPARIMVLRTPGGMLEVATLRKPERFGWQVSHSCPLVDCKELLGKTTSEVQVMAHYTWRIPLEEEWTLHFQGDHWRLAVPPLQPGTPVAFETGSMRIRTEKDSWFSPAAGPNREAVVRELGPELARRARRPEYRQAVEQAAAATVAEFARKWMAQQLRPAQHPIRVEFTAPTPRAAARAQEQ